MIDAQRAAGIKPPPKEEAPEDEAEGDGEEQLLKKKSIADGIPLAKLGFGIESYIDMLNTLTRQFCFAAVIAFVVMIYMYKANGHIKSDVGGTMDIVARMSLGNIGGAKSICITTLKGIDKQNSISQQVRCPKGKITKLTYFGAVAAPTVEGNTTKK